MIFVWLVVMAVIAVVLGVLSRGVPRLLSVLALVLTLGTNAANYFLAVQVFSMVGATGASLINVFLSFVHYVSIALLIAAAALASRSRPPVMANGAR